MCEADAEEEEGARGLWEQQSPEGFAPPPRGKDPQSCAEEEELKPVFNLHCRCDAAGSSGLRIGKAGGDTGITLNKLLLS